MFLSPNDEQTIRRHSFDVLLDAAGLSPYSVKFYCNYLNRFRAFCPGGDVNAVDDITADLLRRYFLHWAENHCAYRTLRSFFHWLFNEEVMPPEWKNPMKKIKPPKLILRRPSKALERPPCWPVRH